MSIKLSKALTPDQVKELTPSELGYWLQATRKGIRMHKESELDSGIVQLKEVITPFGIRHCFITRNGNEILKDSAAIEWGYYDIHEII